MFSSRASAPACCHLFGVAEPAAQSGAVQAGDHRNLYRLLALRDVGQVGVRAHDAMAQFGEVAHRLGADLGRLRR